MYKYFFFLSKLEVIKQFGCDKHRSSFSYKITINDTREWEWEWEWEGVMSLKSFKNKIIIKWEESNY